MWGSINLSKSLNFRRIIVKNRKRDKWRGLIGTMQNLSSLPKKNRNGLIIKNFPIILVSIKGQKNDPLQKYRVQQSFRESYWLQDSERTIASTETNDTSAKSPWFQLSNDILKVLVSLKLTSREVIEVKKSKTRRAAVKFNKICFLRREGVAASW